MLQHVLANLPHIASQRRQEGWASLLKVEVKPEHAQQLGRPMWWQQHPAPSGDVLPAPPALFHLVLQAAGSIYSSLRCTAQAQTEIITHGNPLCLSALNKESGSFQPPDN